MTKNFNTTISKLTLITDDVMELGFKINEGTMYFTPGQFITIKVSNNPFIMRAYSVLEYNKEENEVFVAIKKVEGGQATSKIFNTFKCGMNVEIVGAMGDSLIIDKNKKDIILVATGIGITPILCVLEDLVSSNYEGNIEVIYGNTTLQDMYYLDRIESISVKYDNVTLTKVLSREEVPGAHKGYVTDVIRDRDLEGKHIYMCCSRKVASSFKDTLSEIGFDLSNFSCESA